MGLVLCLVSFVASFAFGLRSLAAGLGAVLTVGYLYGIVRANFLSMFTHFTFDAAVAGFYLALLFRPPAAARLSYMKPLETWVKLLIGWAVVMFLIPFQHVLIQLVGLRGNAFLLPFILVGGWLRAEEASRLALWIAVLNLLALAFGAAEYVLGLERFYPLNPVTELIYRCGDVANFTAFRIPACFPHAAGYGGTMIVTVPWLIGAWFRPNLQRWQQTLLAAGTTAAVLGIFLCASRSPVILLASMLGAAVLSGKLRPAHWMTLSVLTASIGFLVLTQERLQRFMSLSDTEAVVARIEGSVNMNFMELLLTYPLGNGIGAGTNIPYFMVGLLRAPVGLENEYSRILLEVGVVGLSLWVAFVVWIFLNRPANARDSWQMGRYLLWAYAAIAFATAAIGTGMLTAIPASVVLFLAIGFATAAHPAFPLGRARPRAKPAKLELARVDQKQHGVTASF